MARGYYVNNDVNFVDVDGVEHTYPAGSYIPQELLLPRKIQWMIKEGYLRDEPTTDFAVLGGPISWGTYKNKWEKGICNSMVKTPNSDLYSVVNNIEIVYDAGKAYGIKINKAGYYECELFQRANGTGIVGTSYIGLSQNGYRNDSGGNEGLEDVVNGIWYHDHHEASAKSPNAHFTGWCKEGYIICGGPYDGSYFSYGAATYNGFLKVKSLS